METRYKHLTVEERNVIHRGRLEGLSLRAIARELDRSASTVAREIARHGTAAGYDAVAAERGYVGIAQIEFGGQRAGAGGEM
jgi:IS30 family transposase